MHLKAADNIRHVATLPPGTWRINRCGMMLLFSSPEHGNLALVGNALHKLPQPWDGKDIGERIEPSIAALMQALASVVD